MFIVALLVGGACRCCPLLPCSARIQHFPQGLGVEARPHLNTRAIVNGRTAILKF